MLAQMSRRRVTERTSGGGITGVVSPCEAEGGIWLEDRRPKRLAIFEKSVAILESYLTSSWCGAQCSLVGGQPRAAVGSGGGVCGLDMYRRGPS